MAVTVREPAAGHAAVRRQCGAGEPGSEKRFALARYGPWIGGLSPAPAAVAGLASPTHWPIASLEA
jgi:hypothetical protein